MNKLNHVAFIMDGNGRWGQKKRKNRNFGHLNGVKTVKKIVESSGKLKIPILTFYVFSTENWSRPKSEINFLFNLIVNYFEKELDNVIANGIKINIFGDSKHFLDAYFAAHSWILPTIAQDTVAEKKLYVGSVVTPVVSLITMPDANPRRRSE